MKKKITSHITPIETQYKGYKFRSRLEARWAVFFDAMQIEWEYEIEGFEIGIQIITDDGEVLSRNKYLPDFFLPITQTWVEVKGNFETIDWQKMVDAVDWNEGLPFTNDSLGSSRGLLMLGNIPPRYDPENKLAIFYPILQHHKLVFLNWALFIRGYGIAVNNSQKAYADSSWGGEYEDLEKEVFKYINGDYGFRVDNKLLLSVHDAFDIARSSRFEFCEKGIHYG